MSRDAPAWLRAQIRSHNRHAVWLALLSLAAAGLAWVLAYFFFVLILFGLETSVSGDLGPEMPVWIHRTAAALAGFLLVWGVIDQIARRFTTASDRQIIGWHLVGDFFLLPVRLTFAVWGNLSAIRWLGPDEIRGAWEVLLRIHQEGKGRLSSLSLVEPDSGRLFRILNTLQMIDLIDLHRGEADWFYTIRSSRWGDLGKLLA